MLTVRFVIVEFVDSVFPVIFPLSITSLAYRSFSCKSVYVGDATLAVKDGFVSITFLFASRTNVFASGPTFSVRYIA